MTQAEWYYEVRPVVGYIIVFGLTLISYMLLHIMSLWVTKRSK